VRIALCVRYQQQVFRLVWINESTNGIYVGVLGAHHDSHVSYHQDGTRHVKLGSEYHNRFSDTPITSHKDVKQLDHFSLPLTKNWFNSKTAYAGDEKTESLIPSRRATALRQRHARSGRLATRPRIGTQDAGYHRASYRSRLLLSDRRRVGVSS
jgi:hypothetical protein